MHGGSQSLAVTEMHGDWALEQADEEAEALLAVEIDVVVGGYRRRYSEPVVQRSVYSDLRVCTRHRNYRAPAAYLFRFDVPLADPALLRTLLILPRCMALPSLPQTGKEPEDCSKYLPSSLN
jgi:hypothetical protein